MGWCNDSKNKFYNKEVKLNKIIKHEKLFRKDYKYNYLLVIEYNTKKIKLNKGSAIFIHLTKNFLHYCGVKFEILNNPYFHPKYYIIL